MACPLMLITGANGFVGSSLCRRLNAEGIPFVAAVRKKAQNSEYEIGTITDKVDWSEALTGCDVVVHLAARVHIMDDCALDPLAAFRSTNVDATLNLARQAISAGVTRFVFVSSVKVNGEMTDGAPFTASDPPAPVDPYGQSKWEAERALTELALNSDLQLVIVRPPLVYGPGVRANFRRLMQLVKMGIPLPLGSVHNQRSMVALDTLVDLLILCCRHPAASGQVFMVSDDHDVSISELLRMLAVAMGKRSRLFPFPPQLIAGTAVCLGKSAVAGRLLDSLQVDIRHTKETLQWRPPVSMELSLKKTVADFLART